jgi:hypothetical protein
LFALFPVPLHGTGKQPYHSNKGVLRMEIQRGHYVFVFDSEESKTASGTAYIGELDSENFHIFIKRFEKQYTGTYTVKFFFIDNFHGKVPPWTSNKIAGKERTWGYRSWIPRRENMKLLSKDKEIELKLLLRDSLSISAGRIRPLKLAIATANEIREVSGSQFDNVPDVFQEHQDKANAKLESILSELTKPPSVADCLTPILAARKKDVKESLPEEDTGRTTIDMRKYLKENPIVNAPDEMIVVNDKPIAVRDTGIAGEMLWALTMHDHPDEKFRHWAKSKSGVGHVDIAKSEDPKLAESVGEEEAKKQWASEGERIRMQVRSVDNMLAKRE